MRKPVNLGSHENDPDAARIRKFVEEGKWRIMRRVYPDGRTEDVVNMGRLDGNAEMPAIPKGAKVEVKITHRDDPKNYIEFDLNSDRDGDN